MRIIPPTKRQKSFALSARVPSFERDRPPGGPPLVTPQLNGGPARRAVKNWGSKFSEFPGSVMPRLLVPGTEQPCLERGQSSIGTNGLGWLTPGPRSYRHCSQLRATEKSGTTEAAIKGFSTHFFLQSAVLGNITFQHSKAPFSTSKGRVVLSQRGFQKATKRSALESCIAGF